MLGGGGGRECCLTLCRMFSGITGRCPVALSNTPPLTPPLIARKKTSPDSSSALKGKMAPRWELWELVYQALLPSHSRVPAFVLVSLLSLSWRRKWQPTPVFLPGESRGQRSWRAAVRGVRVGHDWATEQQLGLCAPWCLLRAQQPGRSEPPVRSRHSEAFRWLALLFQVKPRLSGQFWEASPLHSPYSGEEGLSWFISTLPSDRTLLPAVNPLGLESSGTRRSGRSSPPGSARLTPSRPSGLCQPPSGQAFPDAMRRRAALTRILAVSLLCQAFFLSSIYPIPGIYRLCVFF